MIRPATNDSQATIVYLGLRLDQVVDVDERKEVITTKVWVEQEWTDSKFTWNPADYGGVRMLHVPAEEIWKPDIVLYNNADGKYEITTLTKAQVFYNGLVRWMPPALYLTSCRINVEFFPYDEQECSMRFGSWTYDGSKVELRHHLQKYVPEMTRPIYIDYAADLYEFNSTIEFEVLSMSAKCQERYYKYSHHAYPEVTFYLRMRRRTIFYTFNLMMPCVAITALMLLTFYLPPESREKISLSINVFISLTLFFLLISETIPPTSLAVPLLGKYLLFTIILITSSIVSTVLVLSLHFRSAKTHVISTFTKTVFLEFLPRLMRLNPPRSGVHGNKDKTRSKAHYEGELPIEMHQHTRKQAGLSNHNTWTLRPRPPKPPSPQEMICPTRLSLSNRSLQRRPSLTSAVAPSTGQPNRLSGGKRPEDDSSVYLDPLVAAISQSLEKEEPCVQARISRKLRQVMHGTDYIAQRFQDVKMDNDVSVCCTRQRTRVHFYCGEFLLRSNS
ncbi:hypothetical protein AAHC03_04698 [Spirometra sp. Aus1]